MYTRTHTCILLHSKGMLAVHSNDVSAVSLVARVSGIEESLVTARRIDERAGSHNNSRRRRSRRIQNALRPLNFIILEQTSGRGGNCVARDFRFELRSSEEKSRWTIPFPSSNLDN